MLGQASQVDKAARVLARPPILCPEYPHGNIYAVLNKLKIHAAEDIGCYTLKTVAPLSVIDTTVCMGASISTLHGMEKAKEGEYTKSWVAVTGDPTFVHTGISSLMNMIYNQATGTVIILDNSITRMAGHQDHAATDKTLRGQMVPAINVYGPCKSLGIEHVCEVGAFGQMGLERIIKKGVARDAVSVIITKAPCALLKGIKFPNKCRPLPDKCEKYGAYLRPGCPALTKNGNGTVSISRTMRNGCGLCKQLCKFDTVNLVRAGE